MKKFRILSSTLVMAMVSVGAYAADEMITGGPNTCTVDVLKVSDNNATANTIAVWTMNEYTLNPGQYLNVTETSVDKTTCPPGSYCVGGADFTVENASTSIATCPTEYPKSRAGAGAQNQCYTACTVATANIAHATAVGGNDYYGDGADACFATDCDTGYHVDGDIEIIERTPLAPVDYTKSATGATAINANGSAQRDTDIDVGLTENNTWAVLYDNGILYGRASCQPETNSLRDYILDSGQKLVAGTLDMDTFYAYLKSKAGTIKADYVIKVFTGVQDGSISQADMWKALYTVFSVELDANYSTDSTGKYCYCQVYGFTPNDESMIDIVSAPWVLRSTRDEAYVCAANCANDCTTLAYEDITDAANLEAVSMQATAYGGALLGGTDYIETGTCAANTINIDWNPDNGGEHTKNMCTYDGEITLPDEPTKPGYTFTGWKLGTTAKTE